MFPIRTRFHCPSQAAPVVCMVLQFINCSDRILTFGIRSICSPAKVGIGCYKAVNYQPR